MTFLQRSARCGAATLVLAATAACSNASALGDILGGVLGGGQGANNQVSGVVRGVDTRSQQIALQLSDGQSVALLFDDKTAVVYQNRQYPVTSLERGDQVTARIQSTGNGGYYTDLVQVDQSVSGSGGTASGNVQALQGTVRQVDQANGMFTISAGNATLLVSMPYNPSRSDITKFQNLRAGDYVRLYGVFLNESRVELRQFY